MGIIVVLGLAATLVYGTSDFLGGFASRRMGPLQVTFLAFLAGSVTCGLLLPLLVTHWSGRAIGYGAVAGVTAVASIWLLYSALSRGAISVTAPLVAVIAALIPVLYGIAHHERLGALGDAAIGVVLISAVLLAYDPSERSVPARWSGLATAAAAGGATGAYLVSLDLTPTDSGAVPILVEFVFGTALLAVVIAGARLRPAAALRSNPSASQQAQGRRLAVSSGITQAVADLLVIVGIHKGHLAVMAALLALYPLGTLACARIVMRERITRVQAVGIILAITASAVLGAIGK